MNHLVSMVRISYLLQILEEERDREKGKDA